ncbi:DUF4936 domain-containing protein [Massilia sp. KIM]|uniref:DUF4936 family protein n=1 Tax=Massilia sp. KIM TaxID=1955422 RepID=UPI00098EE40B|nr:DUF4936 family protein [Massilia sp. KIM]OON63077.1 DUF4936 domain-containing protein [Massilia sp. KIM]
MIDLYVYYKVRDEDAARLAPLVRSMQQGLAADGGATFQLKRRPEAKDGLQTWMEVYPGVDAPFAAALERACEAAGLHGLIAGPRRAEVFTELAPCA